MDLKKLFVYVPAAAEAQFVTNVIENAEEAAKYSNKIVFLESSNRIWVKGVFYGTDLETLSKKFQSIWATVGLEAKEDGTSALSETVGDVTYTDLVAWIKALNTKEATDRKDADDALEAKLPEVAVSGSGLTLKTDTDETTGKKTYTVIADQSIWEFMGSAEATVATVADVLNAKYGEGGARAEKEAGDVWAVTLTDQSNNTVLYAYDGSNWVQIGSAQGISDVDKTVSHGIGLTNTASVLGITVEDGSIADGEVKFITGGTAYTKFNEVITAYEAADAAIISSYEAADAAIKKAMTSSVSANTTDTAYLTVTDGGETENGHAYTVNFSEEAVFNYVSDNIWETYTV